MRTREKMQEMGRSVKEQLPPGCGFALFVWNHGEAGVANYISSTNRDDVIEAVKEFLRRNEEGRVIDTPSGN